MGRKASDDPFGGLSESARLKIALTNIVSARSMGRFVSIEAEVRKAGYQSKSDFWHAALARPITAVDFAEFLKSFHVSRASFDERAFDSSINSVLTLGLRATPHFVIRDETAPRREPIPSNSLRSTPVGGALAAVHDFGALARPGRTSRFSRRRG